MENNQKENNNTKKQDTSLDVLFFAPREVTEEEMSEIRNKFYDEMNHGSMKPTDIFNVMYDYFEKIDFAPNEIKKMADTFWPLFVKVSWRVLDLLNIEIQARIIALTMSFAVSLYINIKPAIEDILTILYYYDDPNSLYNKVGDFLRNSEMPVAFNEVGEKIIMKDFVKQIGSSSADNVSKFQTMADFEKALFGNSEKTEEEKVDESKRFQELVNLIQFFIKGVEVNKHVISYLDSQDRRITPDLDKEMKSVIGFNLLDAYFKDQTGAKSSEEEADFVDNLSKNKPNFADWIQDPAVLRSMLTWLKTFEDKTKARKELEKLLQKELDGDVLKDVDSALAVVNLDEFLNKNDYPGDDLVHYDESAGEFKWGK